MIKYALHSSSIFNIDYAAIPFALLCDDSVGLDVYLNTDARLSPNHENRKYESRLSIPTLNWEMDSNDVWRIMHWPLEQLWMDRKKTLLDLKVHYIERLPNSKKRNVESYFLGLMNFVDDCDDLYSFYGKLIKYTIGGICPNVDLRVATLSELYDINVDLSRKTLIKSIGCLLKAVSLDRWCKLNCGGTIILAGEYSATIKRFKRSKADLFALNEDDGHLLQMPLECLFKSIERGNTCVRYKGMIELFYISLYGHLLHLPSYCNVADDSSMNFENKIYEYVTPMSCKDIKRSSEYLFSSAYRLSPKGYSIIDLDRRFCLLFTNKIIGENEKNESVLRDWVRLYNRYPRSSEKASANQSPVVKYFDALHKDMKRAAHSGDYSCFDVLFGDEVSSFYLVGEYCTAAYTFLRNIVESIHVPDKYEGPLLRYLNKKGSDNLLAVCMQIYKLVVNSTLRLSALGLSKNRYKKLSGFAQRVKLSFDSLIFPNGTSLLELKNIEGVVSKLIALVKSFALEYYKFIVFYLSTVLKSNAFLLSMIYEPEELMSLVESLVIKRDNKRLILCPDYFLYE